MDNVVVDDRDHLTIGRRSLEARRVGFPFVLVLGSRAAEYPALYELQDVNDNKKLLLTEEQIIDYLWKKLVKT